MFAKMEWQEVNIRLKRIIFHIDVNSAFLSWEAVYRLRHKGGREDLREIASAVGGDIALRHGRNMGYKQERRFGKQSRNAGNWCWFLLIMGCMSNVPKLLWKFSGTILMLWSSIVLMKLFWI